MTTVIIATFEFKKCSGMITVITINYKIQYQHNYYETYLYLQSKKRKDVDLRQLLNAKKPPPVYSIADKVAILTRNKHDDESDQDEESELVIEVPTEDEDKEKGKLLGSEQSKNLLL